MINGLRVLTDSQIEEFREATEDLLESVGFEVQHEEILKKAKAAGAVVDETAGNLKLPRPLFRELVNRIPSSYTMLDGKKGMFRTLQPSALGSPELMVTLHWADISDTSLHFFDEETQGLLDSRVMNAQSDDDGLTWPEPVLMDTRPFDIPTATTGRRFRWQTAIWHISLRRMSPTTTPRFGCTAQCSCSPTTEAGASPSTAMPAEWRITEYSLGTRGPAYCPAGAYSTGLPHTSGTPDGDIVAVYYTGDSTDHTGIRWTRLAGDQG